MDVAIFQSKLNAEQRPVAWWSEDGRSGFTSLLSLTPGDEPILSAFLGDYWKVDADSAYPIFNNVFAGNDLVANSIDAGAALPTAFTAFAMLLERAQEHSHEAPYATGMLSHELAHATLALDSSAVSTLIRVVDGSDEDANAFAVLSGQHRLLASKHAWYRDWSLAALPAALLGLTRDGLLELLRDSRRRQRRDHQPRPRLLAIVRILRGQLDRLAHFIAPNAPPIGTQISVPAGVGD
jgi:hypothetical protein